MKDHARFLTALGRLNRAEALLIDPDTDVHALGSRDDVERLLAAADLVVSSSVSESFSDVVTEGLAARVPAVVTNVGDSARVVGATGRIVPPRDPAALAEAIGALFGESNHRRTRCYDPSACSSQPTRTTTRDEC